MLSAAVCALSVPVGTAWAWLLTRTDMPGRRFALGLVAVLLFVPLYLQAAAWEAGFGLQGWAVLAWGLPVWLDGWVGAIFVHAVSAVPWVVLISGLGFVLIEPELEEQALLDGSAWQVFFRVTLPGAAPAVGLSALWVAITTAGEMTVTDLFVVRTFAEELYTQAAIGPGPEGLVAGVAPSILLTALLAAGGILLAARLAPGKRPITLACRGTFGLGPWRWPTALAVGLGVFFLVGVPLGNLLYKAGVEVTQTETGRLRAWSLLKTCSIVATSPWRYRREFGWSLALGVLAATIAAIVAIGLAWWARRGGARALPAILATALGLAVPGPVLGLSLIWMLNRPEFPWLLGLYDNPFFAPGVALTFRAMPLPILLLWHAFRTLPQEMLEAAAVDGAGSWGQLWRIALPCRPTAVVLAWLVALAVALGELAASILVVPPGVTTLAIRIFGLLHYGVEDQVAGICLALVALFSGLAAGAVFLTGRTGSLQSLARMR